MDTHICKVCFRNFTSGSALGGHMRSHMKNFYVTKQEREQNSSEKIDDLRSFESYSSISSQYLSQNDEGTDEDKGVDPEFSSVLIQDRESDTDSSKDRSICRRSKRVVVRDSRTSDFARFGTMSFSGFKKSRFGDEAKKCAATPEENVAYCLMMLSRDKWVRGENKYNLCGGKYKFGDDFCGDSNVSTVRKNKVRGKYRCETCNKMFRSYQALGGHMASHKKIRSSPFNNESSSEMADFGGCGSAAVVEEEKAHECPFCERLFSSGQALGGHKRSHFARGERISRNNIVKPAAVSPVESISRIGEHRKIDLNLPAAVNGDEDEISQIAVSAVFDA